MIILILYIKNIKDKFKEHIESEDFSRINGTRIKDVPFDFNNPEPDAKLITVDSTRFGGLVAVMTFGLFFNF